MKDFITRATSALMAQVALLPVPSTASSLGLDSFIEKQRAISLTGVLRNIGPNGSMVPGAPAGVVVASPSQVNPDYYYTWTRDSAMAFKMLVDEFILGHAELQQHIDDYIHSQALLQTVSTPLGTLPPDGLTIGQARFNVDETRWTDKRPQRDGPALRSIALIAYSHWLISNGQNQKARDVVWPIISNDIMYTGQYWNQTTVEIWEGLYGSSFFTSQVQYRVLTQADKLARRLGLECHSCKQAPQVLCFLQSYWNGNFIVANINVDPGDRSGIDASTVLGSIAIFDINAKCDDFSIQPCHSQGLANFKTVIDIFRNGSQYPINKGIPINRGVAVGRFLEDTYNGFPWYLTTAAAAEYLYDAVGQWRTQKSLTIDETSLAFFKDLYPEAQKKTYTFRGTTSDSEFNDILEAILSYADSFASVIQKHTPANGSLSEQFNKTYPFEQASAHDLTWSYASFIIMAQRRSHQYGETWVPKPQLQLPTKCANSSATGHYAPALKAGAPNVTEDCLSNVLFQVNVSGSQNESVYLSGATVDLGRWISTTWWSLSNANFIAERPLWSVSVPMSANKAVSYGYIRQNQTSDGSAPYIYESVNRTLVVPPCSAKMDPSDTLLTTNDTWDVS
ncbi:1, 4-alpha-D-glucan glucohydrolase [Xylariaceae sp. FL0255]|nr:1, 4-alpha-D-glucan glucohydrolase [Xylariaceae sp. FL0255]